MIAFPNAKINIGLKITDKLENGYHSIKSLMVPTQFFDILEFTLAEKDIFKTEGIQIPGNFEENIVFKVLKRIRDDFDIPPLEINLHKKIPFGAGLGGGSADAAFFLKLLNERFNLGMNDELMEEFIAGIGSDCPFFIKNSPAIVTGTGTTLTAWDINLGGLFLAISVPDFQISTVEAYSGVKIKPEKFPLEDLLKEDISTWKNSIENDFEESLFPLYPQLQEIKDKFYDSGASYASLSGSGSAVYGIYTEKPVFSEEMGKTLVFKDFF